MKRTKAQRRAKREDKKLSKILNFKWIRKFQISQFKGLKEPRKMDGTSDIKPGPTKDPSKTNKERLIERRTISGRLGKVR